MRFVRPADTHKEQNLVLVQQGQSLYFNTTRSINSKTELRIWYSPAYAEKYGLPILEPNEEEKKGISFLLLSLYLNIFILTVLIVKDIFN